MYYFECGDGRCEKRPEIEDDATLDSLDLPYHATAMAVILPDGKEKLVSGVVDTGLVSSYRQALG